MTKPVISAAAGTAASSLQDKPLGKLIEAAMLVATEKATEAGITDPDEVLALKLDARDAARAAHQHAVEVALAEQEAAQADA